MYYGATKDIRTVILTYTVVVMYVVIYYINTKKQKLKRLSSPITGLDRPRVFQEVEALRLQDNLHIKVVRLSALHTGRLYPPRNNPGTHFC